MNLPTPDTVEEWLLGLVFGNPSFVVSTFLVVNFVWAWWSFGRGVAVSVAAILAQPAAKAATGLFKFSATIRLLVGWVLLYGIASFITQIWAGSQYSPGQGGGLMELLSWSALFGGIAVFGCLVVVPPVGPRHGDRHWAPLFGMFLGYFVGLLWAVLAFSAKGGPEPGDWWVCPALSCIGVIGASLRIRIKTLQSWANSPTQAVQ